MALYSYTFDEYVNYIKEKYPQETSNFSPQQAYFYGQDTERTPNVAPIPLPKDVYQTTTMPGPNKEADVSPGFFASMSDYWIDADSPEWAKRAYNNSITGLTEQYMTGKARYDLDESYESAVWEDVLGGVLSFTFPLDIASFAVGGGIGGAAVKTVGAKTMGTKIASLGSKGLVKRYSIQNVNKTAVKSLSNKSSQIFMGEVADKALGQGIRTSLQLGTYEGAASGLMAMNHVDENGNKLSNHEILKETLGGMAHGMALGGIAGYGAGFLGAKWVEIGKRLKAKKKAGLKLTDKEISMLKRADSVIPSTKAFGWEVGVFTTPSVKDEFKSLAEGQGFHIENVFRSALVNAGMVGIMHGTKHTLEKAKTTLDTWNKDIMDDIQTAFKEETSISRLENYFQSQKDVSSGSEKAAFQKSLEVIANEKSKSSDGINFNLVQKKRLLKQINEHISSLNEAPGKATPEVLLKISNKIAKSFNTINEAIGLTGNKELAKEMNDFNANIIKNIKLNTSTKDSPKNDLLKSYRALRNKNKRNKNRVIVERNGQAVEINLKKDINKVTKSDLRKAIEAEAEGAYHGAAENSIKAVDKANKIESYNTTEDFNRGFSFDADGNPIPAKNLSTSRHKEATGFKERPGRTKEVSDRAKNLSDTHSNIRKDGLGEGITVESRNKYSQSKSIILNSLEKFYLSASIGNKYLSISAVNSRMKALNQFAKWLSTNKEKNIHEASQSDIKQFLRNEVYSSRNAKALKEFIDKSPSKFPQFRKGKLNTAEFKKYSELDPTSATETTVTESLGRQKERALNINLNYSKKELRDIRHEVTGKRRFKDMTEAEKAKVNKFLDKILKRPYETTTRELRNLESKVLIRADQIDFSHSNLRKLLKTFGVEGGLFKNIKNPETLKEVLAWMVNRPKDFFVDRHKSGHTDFYLNLSSKMFDNLKLPPAVFRALGMPSWYVLKHYGGEAGKKIYRQYIESQVTTESLLGDYQRQFDAVKKLLSKKDDILKSRDNIDRLRFIDEVLQKTAKSPEDLAFIKKMNDGGAIFLDGKKVKLKKGQLVPWDADFKGGSKEWRAKMLWRQYTDNVWRNLHTAVKNTVTKGEYLKFKQKYDKRYISSYFTRVVNPKVVASLGSGKSQSWVMKIAKKELRNSANAEADKLGYRKGSSQRKKFIEKEVNNDAKVDEILSEIQTYLTSDIGKMNPKYLEKRVLDISDSEGMVEIEVFAPIKAAKGVVTGEGSYKKIKVEAYLSGFEQVSKSYANEMSRVTSAAAHFPDLSPFNPKRFGSTQKALTQMAGSGDFAAYTSKMITRHLGIERDANKKINSGFYRFAAAAVNSGVALGLSTPIFPGLKNLAIGQARNIGAYGLMNSIRGFGATFSKVARERSKEAGHYQSGYKSMDLIEKGLGVKAPILREFNMQNLFRYWNFMEYSEGMNRVSSKIAGTLYFEQMLRRYKGQDNVIREWGKKSDKEFKRFLGERLHFTPEEMNFIDRKSLRELTHPTTKENVAVMNHLTQKAAHFTHISTQGGTQVGMLPLWMSSPMARPLTLFYRMASAATFDTYVNFIKPAYTHRNPYPLIRLAFAHTLTGNALHHLYKEVFGRGNPLEGLDPKDEKGKTSQMIRYIMADAYKSGFFGTVEGLFNPYGGILASGRLNYPTIAKLGQGGLPVMEPILMRYGADLLKNTAQLMFARPKARYTRTEWSEKVIKNLLSDISSFGSQARNKWRKDNAPYLQERKNLRSLYNQYLASKGEDKIGGGNYWEDERYFMYEDLRTELFKKGATKEDRIKAVMVVYNTLVHELLVDGDVVGGVHAHTMAIKAIKASMAGSRPLNIAWQEKAKENKAYREFYESVTRDVQERLYKSESEFQDLKREIEKVLNSPHAFIKYGNLGGVENILDGEYNPTDFYNRMSREDKELYNTYKIY